MSNQPKKRVVRTVKTSTEKPAGTTPKAGSRRKAEVREVVLPFGKMNYILLGLGIAMLGIGFYLMSLDPFIDAKHFSVSLTIAPVVVVAGFIELIFAIMYSPKEDKQQEPATVS